jgi:NADPH2:quinone reductase
MALTGGKGADVCFDPVGGALFDPALSSLGWGGRILLIGFVGGVPQIPANRLLVKHRAALGSSLRYFRWHAPDKLARSVDELFRWYGEGKLRPCITHRLPLERGVEAIRLLLDRRAHGKVVVELEAV